MERRIVNDGASELQAAATLAPPALTGGPSPSPLPVGKPVRQWTTLFQARSTKPKGRGMLWRHTASFRTSLVTCQMLWLPAGKNAMSPGPRR
jgi:hypothetical protein